ncbi:MAG: hypothetical protein M3429_01735 [Verrucomicrobiota bacterium]|nr:hypothetical protein [Chthoniobacterales bacterium]MDQ3545232.1 hypothetical protein [Verrucomicrobiota bacterium]
MQFQGGIGQGSGHSRTLQAGTDRPHDQKGRERIGGSDDDSGATQASYSTPPAVLADDGSLFTVTVSNVSGSVTSRAAKLTVTSANAPASIP